MPHAVAVRKRNHFVRVVKGINGIEERYLVSVIKKAQQQDQDAFSELYAMTYERQYNYAKNYLSNPDDAWDAVQEVYILAMRKLDTLRDPHCINAWLTQINSRVCYDMLKSRRMYITVELNLEHADEELNPENQLLQNADTEILKKQIDKLPYKQKQAITLKYFKSFSLQQIADVMECSISSVTRYLEKGRDSLEQLLKKEV